MDFLNEVKFNASGLVPVIAQDADDGAVLMLAWANREAIEETIKTGRGTYFSRSRRKLWRKGEESGNVQELVEMRLDCDGDALIYLVRQVGGIACHTGHRSCFYRTLTSGEWRENARVVRSAEELYGKKHKG